MNAISTRARERLRRPALIVGAVSGLLFIVLAALLHGSFLQSYLFVWWFLLSIPLGSMAVLMAHNLTGGGWGELIRPSLEAATRMLPWSLLFFIPMLFGLPDLYAWARPADVAASALLRDKAWYLGVNFFLLRAAIYFAVWLWLAHLLRKWSFARFSGGDTREAKRLRAISALGLLAYGGTVTFAAVDWIMSLSPHWYSTTFGFLTGIGQSLSAFCFSIICAAWLRAGRDDNLPSLFHDLGNLLLMFVMMWAYLAFTQYLIIWAEDLPNEIVWYLPRVETNWRAVGVFLIVVHFAVPFLVLLSRRAKRAPASLATLASVLLFAHLVDSFWLVVPNFRPAGFNFGWFDLLAILGMGGLWLAWFLRNLDAQPLPPRAAGSRNEVLDHG